ncbi:MAG: sugar ABC transporter permease [Thermomicrobiales bacterium]|nr:sugar ABC transporter permease [Thermomicrobiales bacterium]
MQRQVGAQGFAYALLIPAFVLIVGVALWPALQTMWVSLHKVSMIMPGAEFIGLENYQRQLSDPRFWNAWRNTVYFTVTSVALETLLGLVIALVLSQEFPLRGWVRAAVLVPWAIPTVVSSRLWGLIFNTDFGLANYLLRTAGIIETDRNWLGEVGVALNVTVLVDVWKTTPFMALLIMAGLSTIPGDLYEAARVDGANMLQRFFQITVPLLLPVLLVSVMLRVLDAFRVFDVIYVMTGGGPADSTEVMSTLTYKILFSATQYGFGSSLAGSMFITLLAASLVFLWALRNRLEVD